jgi:hypothetical protein
MADIAFDVLLETSVYVQRCRFGKTNSGTRGHTPIRAFLKISGAKDWFFEYRAIAREGGTLRGFRTHTA